MPITSTAAADSKIVTLANRAKASSDKHAAKGSVGSAPVQPDPRATKSNSPAVRSYEPREALSLLV